MRYLRGGRVVKHLRDVNHRPIDDGDLCLVQTWDRKTEGPPDAGDAWANFCACVGNRYDPTIRFSVSVWDGTPVLVVGRERDDDGIEGSEPVYGDPFLVGLLPDGRVAWFNPEHLEVVSRFEDAVG